MKRLALRLASGDLRLCAWIEENVVWKAALEAAEYLDDEEKAQFRREATKLMLLAGAMRSDGDAAGLEDSWSHRCPPEVEKVCRGKEEGMCERCLSLG